MRRPKWLGGQGKEAAPDYQAQYSSMSNQQLQAEAEKLAWKPTRTCPGVSYNACSDAEKALLGVMETRKMVSFMMDSKSLGGGYAYYADLEPLRSVIEAQPAYAEANAPRVAAKAAKRAEAIKEAGALPGWESDFNGGYKIAVATPAGKNPVVTDEVLERMFPLGNYGFDQRENGPKTTYFVTKNPELVAEIERNLPGKERTPPKTDASHEPKRDR